MYHNYYYFIITTINIITITIIAITTQRQVYINHFQISNHAV